MLFQDFLSENQGMKDAEPSGNASKPEAPIVPEVPDLFGRDEMNLAEFPIAALTDYVPRGQNTIRFSDGVGSLLITGSDAYGLPTANRRGRRRRA